jgi:hypothetical protein
MTDDRRQQGPEVGGQKAVKRIKDVEGVKIVKAVEIVEVVTDG